MKYSIRVFQYHSGPIKRPTGIGMRSGGHGFQYHSGPIKSHVHPHVATIPIVFQYHSGPIKRHIIEETEDHPTEVSIPLWSN